MMKIISIIGPSNPGDIEYSFAENIGYLLAKDGFVVATGGKGGIMEAALKGAKSAKGITLGILPEETPKNANPYADIVVPTGIGICRNFILVNLASAIISAGYSEGTLTEIAIANKLKKPLIGFNVPELPGVGIIFVSSPEEALAKVRELVKEAI
ncbi:MAG: TIGR00725 family protein [candidate division WOR-3 bacterium]